MHVCNRWGTGEIKIFRGSDYAQIGSVKLLEDADSIGYDPDTKHLYVTNGGGGAHLRVCPRECTEVDSKETFRSRLTVNKSRGTASIANRQGVIKLGGYFGMTNRYSNRSESTRLSREARWAG